MRARKYDNVKIKPEFWFTIEFTLKFYDKNSNRRKIRNNQKFKGWDGIFYVPEDRREDAAEEVPYCSRQVRWIVTRFKVQTAVVVGFVEETDSKVWKNFDGRIREQGWIDRD